MSGGKVTAARLIALCFAGFVLVGCAGSAAEIGENPEKSAEPKPSLVAKEEVDIGDPVTTPEQQTAPIDTPTPSGSENVVPTPTAPDSQDTVPRAQVDRLPPEKWKLWPVIPTLSPAMKEVYKRGIVEGNDAGRFAKVGDCQNVPEAFLGMYDTEDRYYLSERYSYLQETIDHFSGSFGRDSVAVNGGFNFPAIFSPLRADPEACEPGETPLACEIRLHNPSFVIISLEIWYKGRTEENYTDYLVKAVEYALAHNVVPILATKADNVEGDHSINLATARVAYQFDLPLWNFWKAVQPLDQHGIDWERDPDGFHITVRGWEVRSFTALQTLDSLWRAASEYVAAQP